MVSDIMRDKYFDEQPKKSLILYFVLRLLFLLSLRHIKKKYVAISKEHAIWAVNKHNRQEVIDYTTEALAKSKRRSSKV